MASGFTTDGPWFLDPSGRHTLLRGVNFGGNAKFPRPDKHGQPIAVDFERWDEVSFVGRPAPLDELDRHLDRIAHWGFNVLRLVTTWEAIEHAGPGEYDEAYLEYLAEVVRRAGRRGLYVFVDCHQDVWSRWTGGDGAPFWCFEWAGLRPERFVAADAVALESHDWPWGYARVPVATMFTLLFGGDRFCPSLPGVQDRLQAAYAGALTQVATRLVGFDNVLGYDVFNEPSPGYIGRHDLTSNRALFPQLGGIERFSPLDYLAAGDGHTVRRDGRVLNESGASIWADGCPWRAAGVWDLDGTGTPVLTGRTWFTETDGADVRVFADHHEPFLRRLRTAVRAAHPDALLFVEGSPWDPQLAWDDPDPLVVNARHWYDIGLLYQRRFDPDGYRAIFAAEPLRGVETVADYYAIQIGAYAQHSREWMSNRPLLLGEFGLPYNLNDGEAFRTGDYTVQETINEAHYQALDELLVHSTQWNYTPDNTHAHGDGWNDEDLSIFSPDDLHDPDDLDSGGRGTRGFCRPHVLHAAGRPIRQSFSSVTSVFELDIDSDPTVSEAVATEVYIPRLHFPHGVVVNASAGDTSWDDATQRLTWLHKGEAGELRLVVRPAGLLSAG